MGLHHSTRVSSMLIVAVVLMFLSIDSIGLANAQTKAQKDKDKEECAEPLVGLATCLSYVGGDAKAPTPDCCNGLKEVLKNNKKCLCVVVMDRNDPDLGLKINVSLALGLPSVCHTPANVSQCPALLHLPPNSPDAQVFYQFGSGNTSSNQSGSSNHTTTTTPATSPTGGSVASNSSGTSAQQKSNGYSVTKGRRGCLLWEITCCLGVFILCFILSNTSLKLTSIH